MTSQHSHSTTPFKSKKFPVIVVCDGIESPANIGSLFRICDAFGVQEIIFCGPKIDFASSRLKRTARNTNDTAIYSYNNDIVVALNNLKKEGFDLIALEISKDSTALNELVQINSKIALVIGNERNGVSEQVLNIVSKTIHIEMYGNNSSMNVVQAAGIAIYSIINILK